LKTLLMVPLLAGALSCASAPPPGAEDLLHDLELDGGPGGAVLVSRDGSVVFTRTFGLADLEQGIPITEATNFRLASVTKQFTATAILILVERGDLALDQPIKEFFPDLAPAARGITIRHLLTHHSGIVAYEDLIADTATIPVLDRDVLRLVLPVDNTYFAPGSDYRYSNTAYALLALIVEHTSGISFAEFLKKEIFGPLGMDGTVAFQQGLSTVQDRAYGYSPDPDRLGTYVRTDQSMTSSVLGDGGIYSSIRDLSIWNNALASGSVLSAPTLHQMLSPQVAIDQGTRWYGLGWYIRAVGRDTVTFHGGSTVGFRTYILRIPASSSAVIALFNRSDVDPEPLAWKLAQVFDLLP